MNTKKVNNISWWDDNARTSPLEKPNAQADVNAAGGGFGAGTGAGANPGNGVSQQPLVQIFNTSQYQNGQNPNGQFSGAPYMLTPMIQPLVVVPYSTTMPMNPTYGEQPKKGKYYEDVYGEDDAQETVVAKKPSGKRAGAFIAMIVFSVIIIAAAVLGIFVAPVAGYVSIYNIKAEETTAISIPDPVFSFVADKLEAFDPEAMNLPHAFQPYVSYNGDDIITKIAVIALPVAIAIYLILAIAVLISAIVGLCGRDRGAKGYAKVKLGAVAIVMFVCALLATVGGLAVTGGAFAGILDYLLGSVIANEASFVAGYGLFAMIIVPIVIFICTSCAYKRR